MDPSTATHSSPQAKLDPLHRAELVERLQRIHQSNGIIQPLEGVFVARTTKAMDPVYSVVQPSLCIIAQGSKEVRLGDRLCHYDPYHYLLACVELPVELKVLEASEETPYLGMRINISPAMIGSVISEGEQLEASRPGSQQGIDVSPLDSTLLDAIVRLVRLIDSPADARILQQSTVREIVYRLLMGEQGDRLRRMNLLNGQASRIAKAVKQISKRFSEPLQVEEIARSNEMSLSTFHQHFKSVTTMSPIQFQKQLRLREARRLMLDEHLDAATAGYKVGYDDASHFNRDYKRFFAAPPKRHIESLRKTVSL
ncbi:AraC-type transcriptional regulator N-terminus domain protein [Verrucomicrobiia bacterium DG1235]|nr:AraC-type transcriptional regulator N-terminus domain protein [Verrucomicrobiae bacterium DG1235]